METLFGPAGTIEGRIVRRGGGPTLWTIGYEKRSGPDLIERLKGAGARTLVDVRERPASRVAAFGEKALRALCEASGVRYVGMPRLGSTQAQRDRVKETGDFAAFRKAFRSLMTRGRAEELDKLAALARREPVALLCYEREHDECHRSILADLLVERIDPTVVAL